MAENLSADQAEQGVGQIIADYVRIDLLGQKGLGPFAASSELTDPVVLRSWWEMIYPVASIDVGGFSDGETLTYIRLAAEDPRAVVALRRPSQDPRQRKSVQTHALVGEPGVLAVRVALCMEHWNWGVAKGRPLERVPIDVLHGHAKRNQAWLEDAGRGCGEDLDRLLTAVLGQLRGEAVTPTFAIAGATDSPIALMGAVFDCVHNLANWLYTFSTRESSYDLATKGAQFLYFTDWPRRPPPDRVRQVDLRIPARGDAEPAARWLAEQYREGGRKAVDRLFAKRVKDNRGLDAVRDAMDRSPVVRTRGKADPSSRPSGVHLVPGPPVSEPVVPPTTEPYAAPVVPLPVDPPMPAPVLPAPPEPRTPEPVLPLPTVPPTAAAAVGSTAAPGRLEHSEPGPDPRTVDGRESLPGQFDVPGKENSASPATSSGLGTGLAHPEVLPRPSEEEQGQRHFKTDGVFYSSEQPYGGMEAHGLGGGAASDPVPAAGVAFASQLPAFDSAGAVVPGDVVGPTRLDSGVVGGEAYDGTSSSLVSSAAQPWLPRALNLRDAPEVVQAMYRAALAKAPIHVVAEILRPNPSVFVDYLLNARAGDRMDVDGAICEVDEFAITGLSAFQETLPLSREERIQVRRHLTVSGSQADQPTAAMSLKYPVAWVTLMNSAVHHEDFKDADARDWIMRLGKGHLRLPRQADFAVGAVVAAYAEWLSAEREATRRLVQMLEVAVMILVLVIGIAVAIVV